MANKRIELTPQATIVPSRMSAAHAQHVRQMGKVLRASRTILAAVLAALVFLQLTGCSFGTNWTSPKAARAIVAGRGFVAAATRRDTGELSAWLGSEVSSAALATLRRNVPPTRGIDPIEYSASITATSDVQGDGVIQVIVRQNMSVPEYPGRFIVSMTWSPQDNDWRVLNMRYVP